MDKIWIDKPRKIDGQWRIRFRSPDPGFKPKYEHWPADEYSQTFVKNRVKDLKAEVRLGRFDPWSDHKNMSSDPILQDAVHLFLTYYKEKVAKSTYVLTKGVLERFIKEFGGRYKVRSVTWDDIARYIEAHTNTGQSKNSTLTPFRVMFRFLEDRGMDVDPPTFKSFDTRKQKNKLPEIIYEDQLWQLRRAAEAEATTDKQRNDISSWVIYFYTGMRTEELPHIKVGDVDFDKQRVKIGFHKSTKTYMNRAVWLPEECHDDMKRLIDGRDKKQFVLDHGRSQLDHKMRSAYYLFGKTMDRVLPDNDMPLYNLRHSAGCWMLEQGLSIMFVKNQLGHKTLNQVLTYARLTGTGFERELDRIGRGFG